jgi:hypothetical protein
MPRLHRNNAAEWVMIVALTPVAWVWRLFVRSGREPREAPESRERRKSINRPSRGVSIEGLPPRTLN